MIYLLYWKANRRPCAELQATQCEMREDCMPVTMETCSVASSFPMITNRAFLHCENQTVREDQAKQFSSTLFPAWNLGHPDNQYTCAKQGEITVRISTQKADIPNEERASCSTCMVPPSEDIEKASLLVLVHREYHSFRNSVMSWKEKGLLDYVDEKLIWINAREPDGKDLIELLATEHGFRVYGAEENIGIGPALSNLVHLATHSLVLFIEKDFEISESKSTVLQQLNEAKGLLVSNRHGSRADVVHLRSRRDPGHPISGKNICTPPEEDNRNPSIYPVQYEGRKWEPRLFCNLYRFMENDQLLRTYTNRVWRCGVTAVCFDSAQCGWTNNPTMFRKDWFKDTLDEIAWQNNNPTFEAGTYYAPEWILPHWVIAREDGIFRHHEINEGNFGHR